MPKWLLTVIEKVAIFVGIPVAKLLFPNVPDYVWTLIAAALDKIDGADDPHEVAQEFHKACEGIGCKPELKK